MLDSGVRRDRYGRPRTGYDEDAPLDPQCFIRAMRARFLLTQGEYIHRAQEEAGCVSTKTPLCYCGQKCGHAGQPPRHLDLFGLHTSVKAHVGEGTARHHIYNKVASGIARKAGLTASLEKQLIKVSDAASCSTADLIPTAVVTHDMDTVRSVGGAANSSTSKKAEDGYRLDAYYRGLSIADARTIFPKEMLSSVPQDASTVEVLVDFTFSHPGAYLGRLLTNESLSDPEAMGDIAFNGKCKKYKEACAGKHIVFLPYHVNAYGRLHPIAQKFIMCICRLAAVRTVACSSSQVRDSPDFASHVSALQRSYLRSLSVCVQRSHANGLLHSASAASPSRLKALSSPKKDSVFSSVDDDLHSFSEDDVCLPVCLSVCSPSGSPLGRYDPLV